MFRIVSFRATTDDGDDGDDGRGDRDVLRLRGARLASRVRLRAERARRFAGDVVARRAVAMPPRRASSVFALVAAPNGREVGGGTPRRVGAAESERARL